MANDAPAPQWRNFAIWSAAGALLYIPIVWGLSWVVNDAGPAAMLRSTSVAATVGLTLLFSIAVVGFSYRNRPISLRLLRNFAIQNLVAITLLLLALWGFRTAGDGSLTALGPSERVATAIGAALLVVASVGAITVASAHMGVDLMDEEVADEMRERGRLFLYSLVWTACCGGLLVLLGLAGPEGLLSPAAALPGTLVLIVALAVLLIPVWRLADELMRTLSVEAGNIAFYLVLVMGGGWAMLAHLRFVTAPAPLDWLSLVIVLMFVASFIAAARRKLIPR